MIVKSPQIQLIESKSFIFLLPLINLKDKLTLNNILNISLHNVYDREDNLKYKRRVYVFFNNYELIKEEVIKNELFIKELTIDEELSIVSFKIPTEFLLDVDYISTSDYSKCSVEYKKVILNYYKNVKSFDKIKKYLLPSKEQIESLKKDLMLPNNIKLTELGMYYDIIEETFSLSKFLNLKQK